MKVETLFICVSLNVLCFNINKLVILKSDFGDINSDSIYTTSCHQKVYFESELIVAP